MTVSREELVRLPPEERRRLLAELLRERAAAEIGEAAGEPVHRQFERRADERPEAVAVVAEGGRLGFAELDRRANRLARLLRREGVGRGHRVGLCAERGLDLPVGLLAVLKTGAAYLPLDPANPDARLAGTVADAGVTAVLTTERHRGRFGSGVPTLTVDRPDLGDGSELPAGRLDVEVDPAEPVYLIYTSGSTGTPKGVVVEHRQLAAYLAAVRRRLELDGCESFAMVSTFAADLGNTVLFPPLTGGGALHLIPELAATDPAALAEWLGAHPVDVLKIVPSHLRALMSGPDPAAVLPRRRLVLGGEAAGWELVAEVERLVPGCRVYNHYGPTETTVGVVAGRLDGAEPALRREPPALGEPLAGSRVYLLDRRLAPVAPGVPGEVFIGGAGVSRGYWRRPAATAERFVPDPFAEQPGARLYRTGDRARRLEDGRLVFGGRVDHQVKIRGFRVELGEVEAALAAHPGVAEAAAALTGDDPADRRLVAYWVAAGKEPVAAEELEAHLAARLPEPMRPAELIALPAMPRTANGKLDRRALPAPAPRRKAAAPPVEPRTPLERALAGLWREVLGNERIGVHDPFLEAGGDSLLAIRLIGRAHGEGLRFTLKELFEQRTIAALAARLEAAGAARVGGPPSEDLAAEPGEIRLTAEQRRHLENAAAEGVAEAYPLAPMQQGMLFHSLFAPEAGEYVAQSGFVLGGAVDPGRLTRAWRRLAERHPILRTSFAWRDVDEPLQRVHRAAPPELEVVDLSGLAAETADRRLAALAAERRERGFDLGRPPLYRVTLVRLPGERWQVLLSYHHLLLDGWSVEVLRRELAEIDRALAEGRPPELGPARPFRDFVAWLGRRDPAGAEAYWRRELAGLTRPTAPQTARTGSETRPGGGYDQVRLRLPRETTSRLDDGARRRGLTVNTLLQGAWAVVLGAHAGERDVVFGSVVSGRPPELPGVESMVGLFINTLPVRAAIDPDAPLAGWLEALQRRQAEAHGFELTPLLDVQRWSELPAGTPLFASVLVFSVLGSAGGSQDWSMAETGYALNVMVETGAELGIQLTYGTGSFDRAAAADLAASLESVLTAMAGGLDRPVGSLPAVPPATLERLAAWNATAVEPPAAATFVERFAAQAERTPEAVAATDGVESLSYRRLDRAARRLAQDLIDRLAERPAGAAADPSPPVVAVLADRGPDLLTAMIAIFGAGAAYLPLDPRHPPARLVRVLADSGASLALVAGRHREALAATDPVTAGRCRLLELDGASSAGGEGPPPPRPPAPGPGDLAYVLFTSGSTGVPKGAMIEHRGMLNHLQAKVEALGLGPGDAVAQTASQCFDISIWQLLAPLVSGGRVEIFDDETARDPVALLPRLAERGVTVLETVPSLLGAGLAALADRDGGPPALPELRWLLLTGEALPPALARDWLAAYPGVPVLNAYGPTECSDDVTHHRVDRPPDAEAAAVPIGRPLPNTEIHLVDPRLRRVPLGVAGELAVGGAGVGRGYLGDPRRTAAVFVPDPFSGRPGARLYRTGDLARRRRDGAVEFIGRLDHQVKVRGFRIELGEIEAALGRQPGVAEAVVALRQAAAGGATLVGYVRPAAGAEPEPAALRRGLERLLPDTMVPTAWVVVDRFPLTANGKIDRGALPEPVAEAAGGAEPAEAPRDTLELKLAAVWRTALGVPALGIHDDFFDLGGHSLLAVRLMAMVEKETGREVPLSALFAGPTVAELAAVLRRGDLGELWSPLVEIQPAGPLPPLFAIHPTGGDVLCYYHLARLLGRDQPLYGLQARGLDGRQPPFDDMPEIAAFYLDTLRGVQPEGPYYLAGWSFGGLAAFDMARQLREAGERVAFVGIFDSLAPLDFEGDDPYGFSREVWAEWFVLIAGELEAVFGAGLGVDRDAYRALEPEAQLDDFLERMRRAEVMPSEGGQAIARGFWRVHEGNTRAMWRFASQAKVYPDTLTLFRTGGETLLADSRDRTAHGNPVYGWDRLVDGRIDVFRVPGNHNNLLQPPHVETLARRLTEALELARRRAAGRRAATAQSAEADRS